MLNKQRRMSCTLRAIRSICLILFTLHAFRFTAFPAFEESGGAARPLGMGSALSAVADDVSSIPYNPAGVASAKGLEATFTSSRLYAGVQGVDIGQNYFAAMRSLPARLGGAGIAWYSVYTPALYREDTFSVTYGRLLNDLLPITTSEFLISAGASLKYLKHTYELDKRTASDPVFNEGTMAGAVTGDMGVVVRYPKWGMSAGFALKNVNRPDVGLKSQDTVYGENVLGLACSRKCNSYLKLERFTVSLEVVEREKQYRTRAGIEGVFYKDHFALRAGYQPQSFTMGFGYRLNVRNVQRIELDYAFGLPLEVEDTLGTHRLGLTMKFR